MIGPPNESDVGSSLSRSRLNIGPAAPQAAPSAVRQRSRSCPRQRRRTGRDPGRRSRRTYLPSVTNPDKPALPILQRPESHNADVDGPDPFLEAGPIQAEPRDHLGIASFLEPDHPFGVSAVLGLVEDFARDRADGVGGQDQSARTALRDLGGFPPGQLRRIGPRGCPRGRRRLLDARCLDLKGISGLVKQLPAPRGRAGEDQTRLSVTRGFDRPGSSRVDGINSIPDRIAASGVWLVISNDSGTSAGHT